MGRPRKREVPVEWAGRGPLWNTAPIPALEVVNGGIISALNPSANRCFPHAVVGDSLSEALGCSAAIDEMVDHFLATGAVPQAEVLLLDGRRMSMHLGRAGDGVVLVWLQPLSTTQTAEAQVSDTVAMLAHQLRSPLGSVSGSAELLRRYDGRMSPERRARALDRVEASVVVMTEILEDILLAGRISAGQAAVEAVPLELCSVIRQLVADHATSARVKLDIPQGWVPVRADRTLLRHVVDNLLCNAAKYDPSGGLIHVSVLREGEGAVLIIKDGGIGIAPEDRDRVFSPFVRGSNVGLVQGTGLGLSLVRHAVEAMGGVVVLTSRLGEGTQLRVRLPLGTATAAVHGVVDNFVD